ncbi:L,D-transpeptidase family protein [Consotaella salsifontis]|uniref:Lipoprotein-anchoring transpeptidase ErfK/SrfK n=1 Tax=Consotaella salsifontis TaxID=1365950 RepID=A0A1T4QL93_9HYPH|nr:L,D-transpeptidase [Consotaella salsifontis]SKA04560.1 Lipoprotein-anchoring transpeptidase ErfK/SrfK [Consotaella salsifontis]
MTLARLAGVLALVASPAVAAETAGLPKPLSADTINAATFTDWRHRQDEAAAIAATAKADPTIGAIIDANQAVTPPSSSTETVPVTGAPGKVVEVPENSTDVPDQAALEEVDEPQEPDPFLVRLQVLLDRAHASPGVIDGFLGENTKKAIRAYEAMAGLAVDGEPDESLWQSLSRDGGQVVAEYTIAPEDEAPRYVKSLPEDYGELAKLDWLGFRGPAEMLAERFHMDEDLLKRLNPAADLAKAGTTILVTVPGATPEAKVTNIVVDKKAGELLAYDEAGRVVMAAPATIGSDAMPSPSGETMVEAIAPEPTYTYDPGKNFKQGNNDKAMTLPSGPNGPVGSMWIDLSKPTYGIHGTAAPDLVSKSASHGCVRLTNWDAETLSKLVEPKKTKVVFKEG